jgi:hypothetical protein
MQLPALIADGSPDKIEKHAKVVISCIKKIKDIPEPAVTEFLEIWTQRMKNGFLIDDFSNGLTKALYDGFQ